MHPEKESGSFPYSVVTLRRLQARKLGLRRRLRALASLAALTYCARAHAGTPDYWKLPGGGIFDDSVSWSLGMPPTQPGYDAVFSLPTETPYSVGGNIGAAGDMDVQSNNVSMKSDLLRSGAGGGLNINASSGQTASLTFTGSIPPNENPFYDNPFGFGSPVVVGGSGSESLTVNAAYFYSSANGSIPAYNFAAGSNVQFNSCYIPYGSMFVGGTVTLNASEASPSGITVTGTLALTSKNNVGTAFLNMSTGATLAMTLDDPQADYGPSKFDSLNAAGTLDVTRGTAPDPVLGESYILFEYLKSESGTFSSINLPPLDPGLAWNTQNLYTTGSISVVAAVPEPAMGFVALAACGLLTRRRRNAVSEGGGTSDKELRPLRPF